MAEPFLAEIRLFSFNFAPRGWAFCNGQLLPINQNQALFAVLGTTYGGDGQVTFALPDLRGRLPFHVGSAMTLGARGGEEFHTVTTSELPTHNHAMYGSRDGPTLLGPGNAVWATHTAESYAPGANVQMHAEGVLPLGGSQPHENRPPFLVLNFGIALQGLFPSQT